MQLVTVVAFSSSCPASAKSVLHSGSRPRKHRFEGSLSDQACMVITRSTSLGAAFLISRTRVNRSRAPSRVMTGSLCKFIVPECYCVLYCTSQASLLAAGDTNLAPPDFRLLITSRLTSRFFVLSRATACPALVASSALIRGNAGGNPSFPDYIPPDDALLGSPFKPPTSPREPIQNCSQGTGKREKELPCGRRNKG